MKRLVPLTLLLVVGATSAAESLPTGDRKPATTVEKVELKTDGQSVPPAESSSKVPPANPTATTENSPESKATATSKPPAEKTEVIMAVVGDRKITADEFMNYLSQDTRLMEKAKKDEGRAQILREIILDRLIEEGMRREGFLPTDHQPDKKEYLRALDLLAQRYFPEANQKPTEEQLYQYYQDRLESYGIPASIRISQIQFRVPANADPQQREAVRKRAEDALQQLRAGASFADLAGTLSENPQGRVAKGDLGFLQSYQYPWLKQAVSNLAVGQFSEVLESPVGYEILLVQEKRDALIAPYANVRDKIMTQMRQEAFRRGTEAYARKMANEVKVTVEVPELRQGAMP